jgi:hypothetical protein
MNVQGSKCLVGLKAKDPYKTGRELLKHELSMNPRRKTASCSWTSLRLISGWSVNGFFSWFFRTWLMTASGSAGVYRPAWNQT